MGEADNYYNPNQPGYNQQQPAPGYGDGSHQQPPMSYQAEPQQTQPPQYHAPPNANGYMPAQGYGDDKYSFEEAFKLPEPKYNDLWAGLLMILFFLGYVAVSALALQGFVSNRKSRSGGIYDDDNDFSLNKNTIILFMFVLVVSLVLGYAYVWLARVFTKQFIWVTGILNVVLALGTAIFYLYKKYYSAGVVFLIFGLFMAFCFFTWIPRIPFSALMLKTAIDVSKKYGHVYLVSFIGGLIATALAAWFAITLVAIYVKYQPSDNNPSCRNGGCSEGKVIGLIAFVTFTMYWVSEWLKNTIHTIIAGVYGSWYFCVNNFPKDATRASSKRALTYSFGSISLGSLFIAIVQFLRQICSVVRQQEAAEGDWIGCIMACCLGFVLAILEWIIEFLNRYAFCHIALYGKSYFPAAKDTWTMIKDRGIDALINECLIGPVLSFGGVFVGYVCALLAYLYLLFTDPAYNRDNAFTPVVVAFAFIIGVQITNIFTTPLSSGIDTIFVAAGWDPEVMWRDHPELYAEMARTYPHVQQVIPNR